MQTLYGHTSGPIYRLDERQREKLVQGTIRVRVGSRGRFAFDVAGGAGMLLQRRHSDYRDFLCPPSLCSDQDPEVSLRSLALSGGVDGSVGIAPHLAVTGVVRIWSLRREATRTLRGDERRILIGVNGRVGW